MRDYKFVRHGQYDQAEPFQGMPVCTFDATAPGCNESTLTVVALERPITAYRRENYFVLVQDWATGRNDSAHQTLAEAIQEAIRRGGRIIDDQRYLLAGDGFLITAA